MLSTETILAFKNAVLGQRFELSVATVSKTRMRALNKAHRNIDRPTDILSFPLSKQSGEIILCMAEVKTHARACSMSEKKYLPYLVIHGMVHLKGHDHGRIMDELEKRYCRKLGVTHPLALSHGSTNRSRH